MSDSPYPDRVGARRPPDAGGGGWLAALAASLGVARRRAVAAGEAAPLPSPAVAIPPEPLPFRAMLDHLADPLLLVSGGSREDPDARRYIHANSAARDVLRLGRAEGPLSTAIRAPEVLAAVDEALYEEAVGLAEYQPGGAQDRFWRVRAVPLPEPATASGRLALLILRDDTEVRRGEKARADFLANASHELRTPLASLSGFIDTLRGHARDDAPAREKFLAIMHGQAERMRRLIEDLMSLSRIELAEHIAPSGRVDLGVAVIDVADALQPLAAERGVTLSLDAPPAGRIRLIADRDQVLQVIQNLIENAIKFSPRGANVEIIARDAEEARPIADGAGAAAGRVALLAPERRPRGESPPARASLIVRDHGAGIPRADLPRLTERFYRVEGRRTRDYPGTGLGLAIVKHIVNRHRGGLWVESLEGRGASFEVSLPMAPDDEPVASIDDGDAKS